VPVGQGVLVGVGIESSVRLGLAVIVGQGVRVGQAVTWRGLRAGMVSGRLSPGMAGSATQAERVIIEKKMRVGRAMRLLLIR